MKQFTYAFLILLACAFAACQKFEYSPTQETVDGMPGDLNNKNIALLMSRQSAHDNDTITLIYSGDSQRYYDRLTDLVSKVNSIPNVDFFILGGDLADFGIAQEYMWVYERLKKMNVPYICAVGNHDLAADNGHLYTSMFGKKNYSFTYKKYKFLVHDTNGREYAFDGSAPNIPWLTDELSDPNPDYFVGISHVPPYDDDFDKNLENPYHTLFASNPKFILSLHGHKHDNSDSEFYGDGVRYMTSNSVLKSQVVMLKLIHGQIIKQLIDF